MRLSKYFITIILCVFFISGCNSVKETMSGKKKANSDEFLVKKKNPLVLPPNFNELPMPEEKTIGDDDQNKDLDFSEVLKDPKNKKKVNKKKNNSLEKSISKILNSN
tara:strand:+ start:197 stop:517 length:321 start_codon:yes stop_codon:yes gene_type:complete